MWTLDFETDAIAGNVSRFPPKPCGLAYRTPAGEFGYAVGDEEMKSILALADGHKQLFHNGRFDVPVGTTHLGMTQPRPLDVEDTLYQLFLLDPHANSLSLKPSAERWLGDPPDTANALMDWILRNIPGAKKSDWGAHISKAPVELVRPYAIDDVRKTWNLYQKFEPMIAQVGMDEAYRREQRLAPILTEAERRGLRVFRQSLEYDIGLMETALREADERIFRKVGYTFNLDSPAELIQALDSAAMMSSWKMTEGGQKSTAKDSLKAGMSDMEMLNLLQYRGGLDTCLSTFARPWLMQSEKTGRLHPNWNQVRNHEERKGGKGTRTGRLSCDQPNLTNPPNEMKVSAPPGLIEIPLMRKYLLPEDGHIWVKRDYSSQEMRILAHFEDDALMKAYQANPNLDPHAMAQELIKKITGIEVDRKQVKITGFSILYGAGVGNLAGQLGVPFHEANTIREAYYAAIPGIRTLGADIRARAKQGLPLRTYGGRRYLPEPARLIKGVMRSFEYKLLNYLIQGSAADQTKEAVCLWHENARLEGEHFVAALHDEINLSIPIGDVEYAMEQLKAVMEFEHTFDVPIRSQGFVGKNFGELLEYTDGVVSQ